MSIIQNPKKYWDEEKEKEYIEQSKEFYKKIQSLEEKSEKVELEAKSILDSSEIDSETIDSCDQKIVIKSKAIDNGILLKQLLVQLKLSQSNGQSKRLIEQGAVKINEKVVKEKDMNISSEHFIKHPQKKNCHYLVLYVGKKN